MQSRPKEVLAIKEATSPKLPIHKPAKHASKATVTLRQKPHPILGHILHDPKLQPPSRLHLKHRIQTNRTNIILVISLTLRIAQIIC